MSAQERLERKLRARVKKIQRYSVNSNCADCNASYPTWAVVNIGIFVCQVCAGLHRELSTSVSVVKSISLDKWKEEWVKQMHKVGNKKGNEIYCAKLNIEPISEFSVPDARRNYITRKYRDAEWKSEPVKKKRKKKAQPAKENAVPAETEQQQPTGRRRRNRNRNRNKQDPASVSEAIETSESTAAVASTKMTTITTTTQSQSVSDENLFAEMGNESTGGNMFNGFSFNNEISTEGIKEKAVPVESSEMGFSFIGQQPEQEVGIENASTGFSFIGMNDNSTGAVDMGNTESSGGFSFIGMGTTTEENNNNNMMGGFNFITGDVKENNVINNNDNGGFNFIGGCDPLPTEPNIGNLENNNNLENHQNSSHGGFSFVTNISSQSQQQQHPTQPIVMNNATSSNLSEGFAFTSQPMQQQQQQNLQHMPVQNQQSSTQFLGDNSQMAQPPHNSNTEVESQGYIDPFQNVDAERRYDQKEQKRLENSELSTEAKAALNQSKQYKPSSKEDAMAAFDNLIMNEQDHSKVFKVGEQVIRRGQVCTLVNIDLECQPPSCTVRMNESGQLVSTEFRLLTKLPEEPEPEPEPQQNVINPNPNFMNPNIIGQHQHHQFNAQFNQQNQFINPQQQQQQNVSYQQQQHHMQMNIPHHQMQINPHQQNQPPERQEVPQKKEEEQEPDPFDFLHSTNMKLLGKA